MGKAQILHPSAPRTFKKGGHTLKRERELVKQKMTEFRLTGVWMINKLEERGVIVDKTAFSSIMRGARVGPKSELVIKTSLDILGEVAKNPWEPSL